MIKYSSALLFIVNIVLSNNFQISGKIFDSTNMKPLIGANIIIENTSQGAASDVDGNFIIKNIKLEKNFVKVQYIGYEIYREEIFIGESGEKILNISLKPEVLELETYIVTASRRKERIEDAPAAISVITKSEIRRESNTNLGDYIKGTKGIDFTQSGIDSYNITARGFNSSFSSRMLTLTDGRMANVPSLRLTAYNVIPVSFEDVEQIEVVLGPASALYGPNAHSGILNIVTSSPLRSQGTSLNIQGGMLDQKNTSLLKKLTFRTAHKIGNFGFKVSGVALSGQDWTHFNEDEFEGHDPVFIGRPNLIHNRVDDGGILGESGSPIFTNEMINYVDGASEDWVGKYWGDGISQNGEAASPLITQEMIDLASNDPFNRYTTETGVMLWYVTQDRLGHAYADGIDNNGDGAIDELIDNGIDDQAEAWYDGIDNDGDGIIDEPDELGSAWLDRFESNAPGVVNTSQFFSPDSSYEATDFYHKSGFGDYTYDSEGNIVFDTNGNGIFNDNLGSNGLDDDGDWGLYIDSQNNPFSIPEEEFIDLNGNGSFEANVSEAFIDSDGDGSWDNHEPFEDLNGNNTWDEGEAFTDENGNGIWNPAEFLLDFGIDRDNGTGDYGEGNGVWDGESFTDVNGNGIWEQFIFNDLDGDGLPSPNEVGVDERDEQDFSVNYGGLPNKYKDANDDGINDYPEFNVRNLRYDLRLDWEPNDDASISLSHGYAWARNINITGIARYLADGWVYRYYQARARYKNLFFQSYLNSSYSGDSQSPTRNLATGSIIYDRSKKFSAQLQHVNTFFEDKVRFVWGLDYFLTLPDTRGSILSDKDLTDRKDNNNNGEAGSPYIFDDKNDNTWYDDGERYTKWSTSNGTPTGTLIDSIDNVLNAIADGIDNDGDSDDFEDLNSNGIPDYIDENQNSTYDEGDILEPGVKWLGGQIFVVFADGIDNDKDGKIDENIDEGIDEASEDNKYTVNELGAYYQLNWKINPKWEIIQATRLDIHDRLTNLVEFNNQQYGSGYSPFDWSFNSKGSSGLQVSPKVGLVYRPKDNQNFRLTWAKAFNTPTNQALFLDLFVTRVSIFKVYARGASGGYVFPRDTLDNPYFYSTEEFIHKPVDTDESIYFYPSTDPRIDGFYSKSVKDLPELEAEVVTSWELGYKGRINPLLYATLDVYTSHYSSFISPVTFITPIVVEKEVLETDYNDNGIINTIDDLDNDIINDKEDYDESFDNWRNGIQGVTAMDTIPGFAPPVVVGYINYGEVDMWGFDGSLTYLFHPEWTIDLNYSYLGMTEFYNPVTKNKDPINAPRHKAGLKLNYKPRKWPVTCSLNTRYVDGYQWSSGIYFGDIKPYFINDLHLGYEINKNLKINLTINNLLNHYHTEIVGGPSLGRVSLIRLQTSF